MTLCRSVFALAAGAIVVPAFAQVPRPNCLVWALQTPREVNATNYPDPTYGLIRFTFIDGYNYGQSSPVSPQVAAQRASHDILKRLGRLPNEPPVAGTEITENQVAISVYRFGTDNIDQDAPPNSSVPPEFRYQGSSGRFYGPNNDGLCFFRQEDRIYGVAERVDQIQYQFILPHPATSSGFDNAGANWMFTRTYRHPLCTNGYKDATNHTEQDDHPPPLKQWMKAFIAAFQVEQAQYPPGTLPNPSRIYMDCEPQFANPGERNAVFMLRMLKERSDALGRPYWSDSFYGVPGFPTSIPGHPLMTLQELYEAERDRVNAALPANSPRRWPRGDADDPLFSNENDYAMDKDGDAIDRRNRPFAMWYARVCETVKDAVLENCFYSVVREAWPNCRVGNYDSARMDGLTRPTSWFVDWTGRLDVQELPEDTVQPSMMLPRGFWTGHGKLATLASLRRYGAAPLVAGQLQGLNGKWFIRYAPNHASVDSPYLYPSPLGNYWLYQGPNYPNDLNDLHGWSRSVSGSISRVWCTQEPNLYLPVIAGGCGEDDSARRGHPCETFSETFLRQSRHIVESAMSYGDGMHNDRFVPWVQTVTTRGGAVFNESEIPVEVYPADVRRLLAMLRTKKLNDIILFPLWGKNTVDQLNQQKQDLAASWWPSTRDVIDQVYSPYITDFARLRGTVPSERVLVNGTLHGVPEDPRLVYGRLTGELPRTSALEYTLQDTTSERVTLRSEQHPSSAMQATDLMVEFGGLEHYHSSSELVNPNHDSAYMIRWEGKLKVDLPEAAQSVAGLVKGAIEAYDWTHNVWWTVSQIDAFEDDGEPYPSHAGANGSPVGREPTWCSPRYNEGAEYTTREAGQWATLDSDGWLHFRRTVDLEPGAASLGREFVNALGRLRVRLIQLTNDGVRFTTRYDLLQVVPYPKQCGVPSSQHPNGPQVAVCTGGLSSARPGFENTPIDNATHCTVVVSDCVPTMGRVLYDEWHQTRDAAQWPQETDSPEYLLNSRFSLVTGAQKQRAYCRFSHPVWTDALEGASQATQPYAVWYYRTETEVWYELNDVRVTLARTEGAASREAMLEKAGSSDRVFPPGYYAITFVASPVVLSTSEERRAIYPPPGVIVQPKLQYLFRLYSDCNNDGSIDPNAFDYHVCRGSQGTACWADVDDGSGTGTADGGVTIDDLLYFLYIFDLGSIDADVDDGSGHGIPDGGVTIDDLLFYVLHFENGC